MNKALKLRNLGQRERNYHARAGEADRAITTKMVRDSSYIYLYLSHSFYLSLAKALIRRKAQGGKN